MVWQNKFDKERLTHGQLRRGLTYEGFLRSHALAVELVFAQSVWGIDRDPGFTGSICDDRRIPICRLDGLLACWRSFAWLSTNTTFC